MARAEHPNPIAVDPRRVEEAFAADLDREAGETLRLERGPEMEIVGYLVRRGFQGVSGSERRSWVTSRLQAALGLGGDENVFVFPCTPEEYAEILEDF